MKAVILAAGRGSRLKGFTEDKPKCLNKIGEHTMIDIQISSLKAAGINDITIVTGYRSEMLEHLGRTIKNEIWNETNMVSSLLCAKSEFDTEVIVSYADIIYEKRTVSLLIESQKDFSIIYDKKWRTLWELRCDNPLDDAESFMIDENNKITDIGRNVDNYDEIQGQYTGLMKFSQNALSVIKDTLNKLPSELIKKMDMTTLLRTLIHNKNNIYGVPINGNWCEIDTIADLKLANQLYQDGQILQS